MVTGGRLYISVSTTMDQTSPVLTTMDQTSTVLTTMDQKTAPVSTTMDQTSTVSTTTDQKTSPVSTTTGQTSTVSTTVPVFEIPPGQINCPSINDTNAIVNSTSVSEGAAVRVSCKAPYKLVVPRSNLDVFTCIGGHWRPLTPTCSAAGADSSAPVGVIVGCTIGGVACLVLVIIALFMLHKSLRETREQRDRNKEFNDKMDQIGSYVNSTFQDSVGMPVLTMDTRDPVLRGRVAQTTNNPSASPEKDEPPDAVKLGADLF